MSGEHCSNTHLYIINVGKMLLLGLPQKQSSRPIGYIMALLIGPLMGIKDPCKVQNRQVAKLQSVFISSYFYYYSRKIVYSVTAHS